MEKMATLVRETLMPDSFAAVMFSPTEMTLRPKEVYLNTKPPTANMIARMMTGTGMTSKT